MILVDTGVWIDHLRHRDAGLIKLLHAGLVATHPAIIGELALGGLQNRAEIMRLLADLEACVVATHVETLAFIEMHALAGSGIGYVDAGLLASVAFTPEARLWSRDGKLAATAQRLGWALAAPTGA